jgi:predicted transcriptional regulator of viral defense system
MKFERLLEIAQDLPVIETATLCALGEEPKALSVQLARWVAAGKLLQLRRGLYLLPQRFSMQRPPLEYLANLLVSPSYVSLERALSIHGLIPEAVPLVQSITTGRPQAFETPIGDFQYRHVKQAWFFGYRESAIGESSALVAMPEKALLDTIYLSRGEFTEDRIGQLRLQDMDRLDSEALRRMAEISGSPRVLRAARRISRVMEEEREETVTL